MQKNSTDSSNNLQASSGGHYATPKHELLAKKHRLVDYANQFPSIAVAVSGGVDSMLLMHILHKYSQVQVTAMHACSPAVPAAALKRVRDYSHRYGWHLLELDAGEFEDENYLSNPSNRCYFCKSHLYERLQQQEPDVIFSGTNTDDLSDYRPGLLAAKERNVKHPYVECDLSKAEIYQLAGYFRLTDLEHLPAQPCLASRVESGIRVSEQDMAFIDAVETQVKEALAADVSRVSITSKKAESRTEANHDAQPSNQQSLNNPSLKPHVLTHVLSSANVRCRVTQAGVTLELDEYLHDLLPVGLLQKVEDFCASHQKTFNGLRPYKMGSAFIKPDTQISVIHFDV